MRLGGLLGRFRRESAADATAEPAPPLPASMADGAEAFQRRLDEARERLRAEIPPPPPDEE